jgi:uncharacterized integral membrane protein
VAVWSLSTPTNGFTSVLYLTVRRGNRAHPITFLQLEMKFKIIFILILAVLFSIILLQNTQVVTVKLLFWEMSMSRIILVPLLVLFGFVIGFFVGKKSWDW